MPYQVNSLSLLLPVHAQRSPFPLSCVVINPANATTIESGPTTVGARTDIVWRLEAGLIPSSESDPVEAAPPTPAASLIRIIETGSDLFDINSVFDLNIGFSRLSVQVTPINTENCESGESRSVTIQPEFLVDVCDANGEPDAVVVRADQVTITWDCKGGGE